MRTRMTNELIDGLYHAEILNVELRGVSYFKGVGVNAIIARLNVEDLGLYTFVTLRPEMLDINSREVLGHFCDGRRDGFCLLKVITKTTRRGHSVKFTRFI